MDRYADIYEGNRFCLMCRHVCPVHRVTKRDSTSPHGWTLLAWMIRQGMVAWDAATVETMYQCADCGLCQADHPTSRPVPAAIVAARAAIVEAGMAPPEVSAFADLLRRPHPSVSSEPDGGENLALFVSDAVSADRTQSAVAAKTLLSRAGTSFQVMGFAGAGVYTPYTLGLWHAARQIAREMLEEINSRQVSRLLTLSKGDAHAFVNVLPELGVALPNHVEIVEFTDWLDSAREAGLLSLERARLEPAVYHDACHTARLPGTAETARRIVEAVTGLPLEMLWRRHQATPCGAVGGLDVTNPELASEIARLRVREARDVGGEMIITEDPACAIQLEKHAHGMTVATVVELAAAHTVDAQASGASAGSI